MQSVAEVLIMKLQRLRAIHTFFFFFLVCASSEEDCSSSCGSISITGPFRLPDDPADCGMPEYELTCQNNETRLNISSMLYVVKAISYENETIRVVDPGLQSNNCSSQPAYSLKTPDLQDSGRSYVFVQQYGFVEYTTCQQPVVNDSSFVTTSPCINSTNGYHYVLVGRSRLGDLTYECKVSAVPIEFVFDRNDSYLDIWSALLMGLQLSWKAFRCPDCEAAGGYCRYRETYDPYDSDWCYKPCKNALQSKHCYVLAARTALGYVCLFSFLIYKLRRQYLIHAGYVLAARTALGFVRLFSFLIYKMQRQYLRKNESIEIFLDKYRNQMPTRYSYGAIRKMTRGFKEKLGQGGFGSVFKGILLGGRPVAIKILGNTKGNGEEFINEVATIGRIHHVNVVQLIGFCSEGSKRALVYDYMPNGSLDKYIYSKEGQSSPPALGMDKMYDIAMGAARGIEYLHRGCEMQILHFDIKPHNILLDADFVPKISDFGLAKLYPAGRSAVSVSAVKGTIGYIAPELIYRSFGRVSYKSDVYSFGRLLLEMIGRMADPRAATERDSSGFYFPAWLYDQLSKGEDVVVDVVVESESKVAEKLAVVGLWCIQMSPDDRPSMHRVVEMLEGSAGDIAMPPRPSLLFPSEVGEEEPLETESSESSYMLESGTSAA
ncbi:unnamed protein product [Musa acuminata subsp. malaccensis]|uniref:(wild Malaysian banana) hypothetical protein n=1 Tax=Musa acuminata subsp. malaccensis TaxID=214687 RepID=A0A804IEU9_MUSAM|nr:unnamed protein product [Musa acuminata subsp. malaccensis]